MTRDQPLEYQPALATRTFTLENPRKGWQGIPWASVQVGEHRPGRWIWARSLSIGTRYCGSPLGRWTDSPIHDEHPTEQEAIAAAFHAVIRYLDGLPDKSDRAIPQIRAWALVLGQPAVQQELFA